MGMLYVTVVAAGATTVFYVHVENCRVARASPACFPVPILQENQVHGRFSAGVMNMNALPPTRPWARGNIMYYIHSAERWFVATPIPF